MTELRDARLRKAMDEAPDAALHPQQRTREAIRAAAHGAVQPASRRWWTGPGGKAMPWTAALATIALATLVTVMWEGREVPGARPEADGVARAPVLPDAAGTSDVLARTAPAAPAAALRASPASLPWTQVRIESGSRSVVTPRAQAGELPALVMTMLASPSEEPTTSAPPTLRLELAQGDEAAGALELVGDHWRWTRLREARQTRVLRPEPGVAAALRTEAERLLRR